MHTSMRLSRMNGVNMRDTLHILPLAVDSADAEVAGLAGTVAVLAEGAEEGAWAFGCTGYS